MKLPQLCHQHLHLILKNRYYAGGLGIRFSGGFTVSVESVHEFENEIFIQILEILPGARCAATENITYPSTTAILIKKTNKPFKGSILKATYDCSWI
jgi:hypothetical protein